MGYIGSWQHQRDMDKRAVVATARAKVAEIEMLFRNARLQRHATQRPLIYKTNPDALIPTATALSRHRQCAHLVVSHDQTTAAECDEALRLALKIVERRDRPTDPKAWRQLLLFCPDAMT
jgi:hypothetical protein